MAMGQVSLAPGWPVRTTRRESEYPGGFSEPVPGDGVLGGERWFLVWNRDQFGECCCWRGTVRSDGVGVRGSCQRPGKHPWVTRVDGEIYGFAHGAADAVEYGAVMDLYGPAGGARQLAVVLDDLLVIDIDGPRALLDFARVAGTVPKDRLLAVSTTPRGFHVWLDVPGWNQKAVNAWLADWLGPAGGWDATDGKKAGRRGFLLDVRTGENRYVVWPGSDPARRWMGLGEFGRKVGALRRDIPDWRKVTGAAAFKAPWSVDMHGTEADLAWLKGWIDQHSGGSGEISMEGLEFSGSDDELDLTWSEMERWLARLERMGPGTGRNNALNQVAYFSGARCIAAGHSREAVRNRLMDVGESVGTHGVRATVESGLSAGMVRLRKQIAGLTASAG